MHKVCLEVRVYISAVMFADGLLLPPRYVADMGSFRIAQGPGHIFSPKANAVDRIIPILHENTSLGTCAVIGKVWQRCSHGSIPTIVVINESTVVFVERLS